MSTCSKIMEWCIREHPEAVRLHYRHTDGTLRMFRYSDMEYMGLCPHKFKNSPPIPPELAAKVEAAEAKNKPAT